ncbi:MAG: hypothetical protein LBJ36_02900 [Synergistaceae bacterium]|nr:hypothetical protein [Synergistaceae bacterium]
MQKELKYIITALSLLFSFVCIVVTGLRMPWSEEGVLYAIYGSSVGFYIAITMSMFIVWKMWKRPK